MFLTLIAPGRDRGWIPSTTYCQILGHKILTKMLPCTEAFILCNMRLWKFISNKTPMLVFFIFKIECGHVWAVYIVNEWSNHQLGLAECNNRFYNDRLDPNLFVFTS